MTIRNFLSSLLIMGIFSLSGALVFFAIQIQHVSQQIPSIISALKTTNEKVDRALDESKALRILAFEFENDIAFTSQQIPLILKESEKIRALIPTILDETAAANTSITSAIETINNTNALVPALLTESAEIRAMVPNILDEIEATRSSIPENLAQLQTIVESMDELGKNTTEGVLEGVVSGTLKTPFRVLKNFGKAIFGIDDDDEQVTSSDMDLIRLATYRLLDNEIEQSLLTWTNPESDNYGVLKIIEINKRSSCKTIAFNVTFKSLKTLQKSVRFCKVDSNTWKHKVL